ncbi:transcription termination factor MTERF15, mitochondrial-like [Aristolochia californica]|uniref:transcription termination factor MTERF15, mitochondrial-like n=1 Tax=Aristolochia californica TaxID=171875 RepID=UPI0035D90286
MMYRLPRHRLLVEHWNRVGVFFQFSTITTENKPSSNTFIIDYLMKKCGLSREKAIKASSRFLHIGSSEKPDSVLRFLKERGFGDSHIRILLSQEPRFLLSKIDKTLKPKFEFLEELGVSRTDIVSLVLKDPNILWRGVDDHLKPSVDFIRTQFGSDLDLPKVLKRSWKLLSLNLYKTIKPHIEVLRSHGVVDKQIQRLFLKNPSFFACNVAVLKNMISRIEKLNVKFRPGMFIYAVCAIGAISVTKFEAKCKVWNSLGWSDEDIVSAFEKVPNILMISEEKIRAVMDFFVNELGFKPKEIPARMFALSLDNRIRPRHEIFKILQKRSGQQGKVNLGAIADISERVFFKRHVAPYMDKIPDLQMYTCQLRNTQSRDEVVSL